MPIHPTAIVHKGAEIDVTADIGPFCIIGPRVKIGPHTRLLSHVVVDNHATIGARNVVSPHVVLGGLPQDLKYRGEPARLLVGDDNVIRESVTMNIGTDGGHMETRVGSHNLFMAYSHVAHDCQLGDHIVLANSVGLAGHVTIGDHAILGGLSAVHQFCRIGSQAFIGGGAMVAQDVPPFCIAQGDRATLAGINVVGLRRSGWTRERLAAVRQVFVAVFQSGVPREEALRTFKEHTPEPTADVADFLAFIAAAERGVCIARRPGSEAA